MPRASLGGATCCHVLMWADQSQKLTPVAAAVCPPTHPSILLSTHPSIHPSVHPPRHATHICQAPVMGQGGAGWWGDNDGLMTVPVPTGTTSLPLPRPPTRYSAHTQREGGGWAGGRRRKPAHLSALGQGRPRHTRTRVLGLQLVRFLVRQGPPPQARCSPWAEKSPGKQRPLPERGPGALCPRRRPVPAEPRWPREGGRQQRTDWGECAPSEQVIQESYSMITSGRGAPLNLKFSLPSCQVRMVIFVLTALWGKHTHRR